LIEFALVFPLLLVVTAGIVDLGLLIKDYQVVTNAAREGARLGAVEGTGDDIVEARVATYIAAGGLDGVPGTVVQEVVVPNGGGLSFNAVDVIVSYEHEYLMLAPLSGLIQALSLPPSVTLKARATMRREVVTAQ
jgi:hypothetical protein